jgi:exodeoxyribonuclease VII small subunit
VKPTNPRIEEIKYADALSRLYQIVEEVEAANIDVDELEAVVKEAVLLITACRAKLAGTQSAVELALAGLKADAV